MRNLHAPPGQRFLEGRAALTARHGGAAPPGGDGARQNPDGEERARGRGPLPFTHEEGNRNARNERNDEGNGHFAHERAALLRLPVRKGPRRKEERHRDHDPTEDHVEVGRPHRNLRAVQSVDEERIERPQKDRAHRDEENHVVRKERALAREPRVAPRLSDRRSPPGKEQEGEPDHEDEEDENEDPALRIARERVHRREHARAHEEGPKQRKREGQNRKEHRPDLEETALFRDGERVHQGRAREPRHEGGIFHRVPGPPAAPAEFVVGPVGSETDAERQEHPARRRPRTHPARPGDVEASAHEGRHREGEGDRKAHVPKIEERRMEDHPRVLQEGIEVRPLGRFREETQEGIRSEQNEKKEPEGDERERTQNAREHLFGETPRRERHGEHPPTERRHPKENRALVRAPDGGEFVVPGQRRITVARDVQDREVARHETVGKRADRHRGAERENEGARRTRAHPTADVPGGARQRQKGAEGTHDEREDQSEMTDFSSHGDFLPMVAVASPEGRSLPKTTSFGSVHSKSAARKNFESGASSP